MRETRVLAVRLTPLFILVALLFLANVSFAQTLDWQKIDWPAGPGVCSGGYTYQLYDLCRDDSHPLELQEITDAEACGTEPVTRSGAVCGGKCKQEKVVLLGSPVERTKRDVHRGCKHYDDPNYCSDEQSICEELGRGRAQKFASKGFEVEGFSVISTSHREYEEWKGVRGPVPHRDISCNIRYRMRKVDGEETRYVGRCTEDGDRICEVEEARTCRPPQALRTAACGIDKEVLQGPTMSIVEQTLTATERTEVATETLSCPTCEGQIFTSTAPTREIVEAKVSCLLESLGTEPYSRQRLPVLYMRSSAERLYRALTDYPELFPGFSDELYFELEEAVRR